jgi:RNA polymerase sigma factor (TIGR02999 family)
MDSAPDKGTITALLLRYSAGEAGVLDGLLPEVYAELKRLAASYMRREKSNHTLQATALVNEAYLRLIDQDKVEWKNRAHFFGFAAQVMRHILVDHARRKSAEKRGGGDIHVAFQEEFHGKPEEDPTSEILALDQLLERLGKLNERQAKIVELRYFAGLGIEETATALNTSPATVKRVWTLAKAWLHRELEQLKA